MKIKLLILLSFFSILGCNTATQNRTSAQSWLPEVKIESDHEKSLPISESDSPQKEMLVLDETDLFTGYLSDNEEVQVRYRYLDEMDLEQAKGQLIDEGAYGLLYIPCGQHCDLNYIEKSIQIYSKKTIDKCLKDVIQNAIQRELESLKLRKGGVDLEIIEAAKTSITIYPIRIEGEFKEENFSEVKTTAGEWSYDEEDRSYKILFDTNYEGFIKTIEECEKVITDAGRSFDNPDKDFSTAPSYLDNEDLFNSTWHRAVGEGSAEVIKVWFHKEGYMTMLQMDSYQYVIVIMNTFPEEE